MKNSAMFWQNMVVVGIVILALAVPVKADLSPPDQLTMTTCLETLSNGWDQPSVDTANTIIVKPAYTPADWQMYFASYFITHKLTYDLYNYLIYPTFFWFDDSTHYKLQFGMDQLSRSRINSLFQNHPADLGQFLDSSELDKQDVVSWLRFRWRLGLNGANSFDKQAAFNWTKQLIATYPNWLSANSFIDPTSNPYVNWLRTQTHIALRDGLPLTAGIKSEIATTLQMSSVRLELWNTHATIIHDNQYLQAADWSFLQSFYDAMPSQLTQPGNITVNEALGNWGTRYVDFNAGAVVNIFASHVGLVQDYGEFPNDVPPFISDQFAGVAVHETNHIVDSGYIQNNAALLNRRGALLQDAGNNHLNYLRSMFSDGFFQTYPQEFFASISNQFCVNTERTFQLGRIRLEQQNRHQPIEQFLFFLDVYSQETNVSKGYLIGADAIVNSYSIPLQRDAQNRIVSFSLSPSGYFIIYGTDAHVSGVVKVSPISQSFTPASANASADVTAPSGYSWTAVSNDSWITIASGGSGTGNGTVNYSVDSNLSVNSRTGTITVAGQTFTVNQSGLSAVGLSYYKTDFDSDGKTDIGFYRSGLWGFLKSAQSYSLGSAQFFSWGGTGLQPIVADFDGDGKADIAYIVPPSGGQSAAYAILQSSRGYSFAPGDVLFFPAGFPVLGDTPVVGDFDGDGKADPGIWRASQGVWIIPKSSTNYTSYIFSQWGQLGDVPVIADFDHDGKADIGFYRDGLWGVLKSGQNYSLGSAQFFSWGGAGLQPIVGDFDGDGKADIGYIVPPSGGQSAAYAILKSSTGYSFLPGDVLFVPAGFPVLGDTPVVGDFDGDGKDDPGIWRESQGVWILPRSSSSYTTFIFSQWGQSGDIPFPNSTGKH